MTDTGAGIDPEFLPFVFEPFRQKRSGNEGGLGLGLSLCETLAASMGGRLAAGNQAVRGAVFTLWLPQHR